MKRFLIKLSYTVLPLWLFAVGLVVYVNVYARPRMKGDFGRLGYILTQQLYDEISDNEVKDTLYRNVCDTSELRKCRADVLTIGDSFFNESAWGYQNCLVKAGLSVVNYLTPGGTHNPEPLQLAFQLLDKTDGTHIPVVVVESVERDLIHRVLNLDTLCDTIPLMPVQSKRDHWSLLEAKNYVMLKTGYEDNPVKHCTLSRPMFTGKGNRDLYFYFQDLDCFGIADSVKSQFKTNLELLFRKAQQRNIRLFFLVCPDKYDVYQDFIVGNPYPRKTVNEDLRALFPDRRDLIIGKEIIAPYIKNGEPDIYMGYDTHWSYKAARLAADTLANLIWADH